jgi:Tfp pilus assembly protein PilN
MPNEFNFARAPFVNERAPRLVFGLSLLAVLALTLAHGYLLTRYLLREQEALDVRVEEIRKEIAKADEARVRDESALARDQTALGGERTSFLVRLYRRKSFSWTGLFNELEAITPPPVRVTSIVPSEEKGRISVTLTVVGRTLQDVLAMVRALESSSFFATVFPVDETNLEEQQGQGTGIAATLKLDYVEGARGATARDAGTSDSAADSDSANAPARESEERP